VVALVAVILIFSIPILDTILSHFRKQAELKKRMLEDELELEKIKYQNYLLETEKLRLELEKMNLLDFPESNKADHISR